MLALIGFFVFLGFSVIDFLRGVKQDELLVSNVKRLENDRSVLLDRISDLEKELRDVKIERNIYKDFVDDFYNKLKIEEIDNE